MNYINSDISSDTISDTISNLNTSVDLFLDYKIKLFEIKLLTYIDIYNIKYTNETINIFENNNIKLERIGNIEIIHKNFNNTNKKIAKQLRYSIYKFKILLILEKCNYILNYKGVSFDFVNFNYELYNVIGIDKDSIYIIHKKKKELIYNFEGPCIIYIFIKDKIFTHHY
jgi:hypothetical protein